MLLDLLRTGSPRPMRPTFRYCFKTSSADAAGADRTQTAAQIPARFYQSIREPCVVVVPPQIRNRQHPIQVLNNNAQIAQITAVCGPAAPGLFTNSAGQAMAVNEDGTLNWRPVPRLRIRSWCCMDWPRNQRIYRVATVGGYAPTCCIRSGGGLSGLCSSMCRCPPVCGARHDGRKSSKCGGLPAQVGVF